MSRVIVIGDGHVTNNQDLSRWDVLGNFIVDTRPDYIVSIGDFLTLDSLSAWDMSKRAKMEGRRYQLEIDAGNEALDRMLKPLKSLQKKQRADKKKVYRPEIVYINGNHEDRLDRYLEQDPTFEGFASVESDLQLEKRGITFVPYRDYFYIDGVGFTHVPFDKIKPISGVDITRKASMVNVDSVVFGHTHELHVSNVHKQGQKHLQQVLNCGCYFEHKDDYVAGRMTNYWIGIVVLDIWKHGRFDINTYALSNLRRMYGDIPK